MPNKVYNVRSPLMWENIKGRIDFKGKTVADYGFGYGDLLLYAAEAGAEAIKGLDKDCDLANQLYARREEFPHVDFYIGCHDIETCTQKYSMLLGDIAFCCSVLPYLREPFLFLESLYATGYEATLIECQYAGDGPGFDWLKDDSDMRQWLNSAGWDNPVSIGKTYIEDRDKYRTIWMCRR